MKEEKIETFKNSFPYYTLLIAKIFFFFINSIPYANYDWLVEGKYFRHMEEANFFTYCFLFSLFPSSYHTWVTKDRNWKKILGIS